MFKKIYLAADIGGTNTRIAIISDRHELLAKKSYSSIGRSFEDILQEFLSDNTVKTLKVSSACIAIAGPIDSERSNAQLTNNPMHIIKDNIEKLLRIKVFMINDFEAAGFAMNACEFQTFEELTPSRKQDGSIVIIGAGTGLGVSILRPYNDKFIPYASEGGHASLPASGDPLEKELYAYISLKKKPLEYETILSGQGIMLLYDFFNKKKCKHNKKISVEIKKSSGNDAAHLIAKYALEDKDPLCVQVMGMFVRYYAYASRNLVLTSLASRLVIAGGIAPKILPLIKDTFMEYFAVHEREFARKLLEGVDISVATNPDMNLHGCIEALKMFKL